MKNIINSSQDKFPKLPKPQKIYCCNCCADPKYESTLTMAAVILANISPMMSIAMVSRTFNDTIKTANNTKKLPKLAAITMLHFEIKNVIKTPPKIEEPIMTKATPKLAPELIPNTKGPANGFLNNVCINNPEIPKPEPTNMAVIAFGKR